MRVALLSVTAAGVGLDFSSASVVVFAGGQAVHLEPVRGGMARRASGRADRLAVYATGCD